MRDLIDTIPFALSQLWAFIKRTLMFLFIYGRLAIITYGLAIVVPVVLELWLDADHTLCLMLTRILLTIAPVLPTLLYGIVAQEEQNEEVSMDLCFATWIITLIWAWKIL